jgi:hypothetical protein
MALMFRPNKVAVLIIPPGFMFHTARVISMVFHSSGLVLSQPIAVAPRHFFIKKIDNLNNK